MSSSPVLVYVIVDKREQPTLLRELLEARDFRARTFASGEEFLAVYDCLLPGIILLDLRLPGMGGAFLLEELSRRGCWWPVLVMTGDTGTDEMERARHAGAINVLRKPIEGSVILEALKGARDKLAGTQVERRVAGGQGCLAMLTPGELSVLNGLRGGLPTRKIAANCAVSERTVRARLEHMLKKAGAKSRADLLQLTVPKGEPVKPPE